VITYHLLTEGRASARLVDGQRIILSAGDIVIFPHGDGRPLRKTWLSRGSQAMKPQTNLVISPPPPRRDTFNPWDKMRSSSFTMSTAFDGGPFSRMCASTSYSVAQIASEVGYESEAAFNRAFKREFTVPPARVRSQSRSAHATTPASNSGG
jgi:AraC-like DNA-binding protein